MNWLSALQAAYGPASAVAIFAMGFVIGVLWKALWKSTDGRLSDYRADHKLMTDAISAAATGDAKSAEASNNLAKAVGDNTRATEAQANALSAIMPLLTGGRR